MLAIIVLKASWPGREEVAVVEVVVEDVPVGAEVALGIVGLREGGIEPSPSLKIIHFNDLSELISMSYFKLRSSERRSHLSKLFHSLLDLHHS